MATTAPTPAWSMGNIVQYTKSGVTDDTEQWSLGNILSFLEYEEILVSGYSCNLRGLLLGVY